MGRFVDRELPADLNQSLRQHWKICPDCRQQIHRLRRLRIMLTEDPTPAVPDHLIQAVLTRISRDSIRADKVQGSARDRQMGAPPHAIAGASFWACILSLGLFGIAIGMLMTDRTLWADSNISNSSELSRSTDTSRILSPYGVLGSELAVSSSLADAYTSMVMTTFPATNAPARIESDLTPGKIGVQP